MCMCVCLRVRFFACVIGEIGRALVDIAVAVRKKLQHLIFETFSLLTLPRSCGFIFIQPCNYLVTNKQGLTVILQFG